MANQSSRLSEEELEYAKRKVKEVLECLMLNHVMVESGFWDKYIMDMSVEDFMAYGERVHQIASDLGHLKR